MNLNILKLFKKEEVIEATPMPAQKKKQNTGSQRSFRGAAYGRFTNWLFSSFTKVNADLKSDLQKLVVRCRDLAKNNEIFRSHLNNIEKSIVGQQGFRLQSLVKENGELQETINAELENAWWDFGKRSNGYITEDGEMGDKDLDALILRTLLIDGEVFIKINKNAKNPYGISFSLIDSLSLDSTRNEDFSFNKNAIVMGIEIDRNYRPVKYHFREGTLDTYQSGKEIVIDASEIIHIYKKEFIGQVRGFPEICASLDSLKQLDDYGIAELMAAKVAACQNIFYERTGAVGGDWLDQNSSNYEEKGTFIREISPGESSIVPQGYTVKSVSPNHPNTNYGGFVKAIVRRIASSVGVSYNRLSHDYESVSYSSLREASVDEGKTYATIQRFIIENWKELEYKLFVISYIINNTSTKLRPSKVNEYLNFQFIPRRDDLFDPAKDVIAVERKLKLGLTNPIIELERRGLDVDDVLDGWKIWSKKCEDRDLIFTNDQPLPLDIMDEIAQEENHPDKIDDKDK